MMIGADETITAISATTENASYPAANLLDSDPKNPWRATTHTATLTLDVSAGTDMVAIFGIENATSVTITVYDALLAVVATTTQTITDLINRAALAFTPQAAAHTITIALTGAGGTIVGATICRAADSLTLPEPELGLQRSFEDYSVRLKYKVGGYYFSQRGRARKYAGTFDLTDAEDEDLQDACHEFGPLPLMVFVVDGVTYRQKDAVFGSLSIDAPPTAGFVFAGHKQVRFNIDEVI